MRRVLINMQNSLFCNAISETLKNSENEFDTYTVDSPEKIVDEGKWISPYALLMEASTSTKSETPQAIQSFSSSA